jgi:hypothetical protein
MSVLRARDSRRQARRVRVCVRGRGIALVEVLVALVIVGLVVSATAASLSRLSDSKRRSNARHEAASRADEAATLLAIDLASILRDGDLERTRVVIAQGQGVMGLERDGLLIITRSGRAQRSMLEGPEGGEYEVQYRIEVGPDGLPTLWWRRDHAMDPYQDAGGMARAIGPCVGLSVEAYDGTDWYEQWDSDDDGLPHAVRVMVTGTSDDGTSNWTARRTVAIDRVPLPPESEETSATGRANEGATGSGSSGGSGGTR